MTNGFGSHLYSSPMKAGTIISYEVPNIYPGCQYSPTMPYSARLTGFGAAYDEMMARWSKM